MIKAWNKEGKYFGQTYEDTSALDSCVLIMPLVFFMPAVSFITLLYKTTGLMDLFIPLLSPILASLAL